MFRVPFVRNQYYNVVGYYLTLLTGDKSNMAAGVIEGKKMFSNISYAISKGICNLNTGFHRSVAGGGGASSRHDCSPSLDIGSHYFVPAHRLVGFW